MVQTIIPMSEISELLERFRRGPELLAVVLTGVFGEEEDFSTGADRWSIRQIIAHLADAELVGGQRFRQVIAEENPTLMAFNQAAWARRLGYEGRRPKDSLESFRRLRRENYEVLRTVPEEEFARTGNHSERGRLRCGTCWRDLRRTRRRMRRRCSRFATRTGSSRRGSRPRRLGYVGRRPKDSLESFGRLVTVAPIFCPAGECNSERSAGRVKQVRAAGQQWAETRRMGRR